MACPVCGGKGILLGILGTLRWYRCRQCGMQFNKVTKLRRRPA